MEQRPFCIRASLLLRNRKEMLHIYYPLSSRSLLVVWEKKETDWKKEIHNRTKQDVIATLSSPLYSKKAFHFGFYVASQLAIFFSFLLCAEGPSRSTDSCQSRKVVNKSDFMIP
ncbi:hypothetical protein NPIL_301851 [Nephila pilipes]|uniref:Uncharacterized protein n=1 Tax=Nephila pilipes TaxID=299642 RepID=A0A8X6U1N2_NEPPI|nr:hypothetical protein NPIL_301851 [Nephila pilipes]